MTCCSNQDFGLVDLSLALMLDGDQPFGLLVGPTGFDDLMIELNEMIQLIP